MGRQDVPFPFVSIRYVIVAVIQLSKITHLMLLRDPGLLSLCNIAKRQSDDISVAPAFYADDGVKHGNDQQDG